jgi:secreted PhoX family phosphatase
MRVTTRRRFLAATTAAAAVVPFSQLFSRTALARDYGPLVPDPEGRLDLPDGFSYTIVEEVGDAMDDGFDVPSALDGMACFAGPAGTLVLMRNHEITSASGNEPEEMFDADAGGGVTRIVVDARTGARISSNWVLAGTRRNCAGGPSPWGWLTCEENVDPGHGYVFLTEIDAEQAVASSPITGYGRFNHEAVAVDPDTLVAYLTEDRGDGCLYRFVPDAPADPFTGRLQALRVVGREVYPTEDMVGGDSVECDWVDVPDPDPDGDTVRVQAQDAGAANVARGEGIWFWDGQVFFASTSGGPLGIGQIFRVTDAGDTATLECVVDSKGPDELQNPDNVTVSPWGQVFIAEDADGTCFIRAITDTGEVVSFARNAMSDSELAGVCFSPDGKILFVNSQSDGITYAITGPFPDVPEEPGDDTGGSDDDGTEGGADSTGSGGGDSASAGESGGSADDGSGGTIAGSDGGDTTSDSAGADMAGGEGCGCDASASGGPGLAAATLGALILAAPSGHTRES